MGIRCGPGRARRDGVGWERDEGRRQSEPSMGWSDVQIKRSPGDQKSL